MRIAVIIPCRNEERAIEECIRAIYNSILPEGSELNVAVVDGKSNDATLAIVSELQREFSNLKLVTNEKQLTPFAFNLGIQALSNSDFFQIVGARQVIDSSYLSRAAQRLSDNPEIWCVGGAVNNVYLNETGQTIAAAMATTFGMGLGNFRTLEESGFVDTVGTPMYGTKVFEQIGYFDEDLIRNQDDDFNYRVIKAGGKVFFDAEISVKYYVRGNFKGLWKQFFQYGYWKVYVNKKHGAITTLRQLVPPIFVVYLSLWLISLMFGLTVFIVSGLPLFVYLLMGCYFAIKASTKGRVKFMGVLKTFPILHVSYGLGYLKGIWDFFILGKQPSKKQMELSR